MGIFFTNGETKKRAGVYQRYENVGTAQAAGAVNGIAAAVIQANWGPLGSVRILDNAAFASEVFGTAGTVEVLEELFHGGASVVKAVRAGTGGTKGTVKLKDTASSAADAVKMETKYVGDRQFQYTIQTAGDGKELTIYENNVPVEKISFSANGGQEADALINAGKTSKFFDFTKETGYSGTGAIAPVETAADITKGTNPSLPSKSDYSAAFSLLEPHRWNVICVDTVDTEVHGALAEFLTRAYQDGTMAFGVIGEPLSVALDTRLADAKAYNDYKIVYVGGGYMAGEKLVDGYLAAARVAGMIASVPSSQSITHNTVSGATDIAELLTNSQYEQTITNGMLTFSMSSNGNVWVEAGITTLNNPQGEDDEGWKKIKRTKIRFELMNRVSDTIEPMIGKINNNADGQANVIQAVGDLLDTMVAENKLLQGASVQLDPSNPPAGDSAWFIINADDVDALEKTYFNFKFQFAPQA